MQEEVRMREPLAWRRSLRNGRPLQDLLAVRLRVINLTPAEGYPTTCICDSQCTPQVVMQLLKGEEASPRVNKNMEAI